jgi:hypothetical protein
MSNFNTFSWERRWMTQPSRISETSSHRIWSPRLAVEHNRWPARCQLRVGRVLSISAVFSAPLASAAASAVFSSTVRFGIE